MLPKQTIGIALTFILVGAEAILPANAAPLNGIQRTGKERLGEKWKDEQRIDNCKVPPEKRGAKPRPDSC